MSDSNTQSLSKDLSTEIRTALEERPAWSNAQAATKFGSLLSYALGEIERLQRERDEREEWAAAWHRVVEAIATILDLSPAGSAEEMAGWIGGAIGRLRHELDEARAAHEPPAARVDRQRLRNEIGGFDLQPDVGCSDNLAIGLCTYFEGLPDRPKDDSQTDNGWGSWTESNVNRVLDGLTDLAIKRASTPPPAAPADREDMENIGRALLDTIHRNLPDYSWSNCPSGVVVDLINQRDDARASQPPGVLRDAARYEWLRERWCQLITSTNLIGGELCITSIEATETLSRCDPQTLDQAIDSAIDRASVTQQPEQPSADDQLLKAVLHCMKSQQDGQRIDWRSLIEMTEKRLSVTKEVGP